MRGWWSVAAVAALGANAPAERTVAGDGVVAVTVNGTPARLRIEPGAPGLPIVTGAFADRAALKGGGVLGVGVRYLIGREEVHGRTAVARVSWAGGAVEKQRVGWMSRDYPIEADGTVGPGGVDEPVVRFVLHPARGGERTVALPMEGGGGLFGGWSILTATIQVGGRPMVVRFDPRAPLSTATAPAAVRLATAQEGVLTDRAARQEIAFGIERPLRVMQFARPLAVGPLSLGGIAVRVTDGAGANTLRQEGDDPSEVVVTGKGKVQPGSMMLGADALGRCSELVFDKPKREVRLTCLPG